MSGITVQELEHYPLGNWTSLMALMGESGGGRAGGFEGSDLVDEVAGGIISIPDLILRIVFLGHMESNI